MVYSLAGILAAIKYKSESGLMDLELARAFLSQKNHLDHSFRMIPLNVQSGSNMLFWYNQDMNRSLGLNVMKGNRLGRFRDPLRRQFLARDLSQDFEVTTTMPSYQDQVTRMPWSGSRTTILL